MAIYQKTKTIYVTQTVSELDENGAEVQKEIQVPQKVMAYYRDDMEITKEQYDAIIASLPKPKAPTQEQIEASQRIEELKAKLSSYDYIGVKIAMGVATPEDYAKEIAKTEEIRIEIRKLEALLDGNK